MTTRIKLRRDTATSWATVNPVLALGEAGYDTTNHQLRVGDGTTQWSSLSTVGLAVGADGQIILGTGTTTAGGADSIAIGTNAGVSQLWSSVAIGNYAGNASQGASAVAIGRSAGETSQAWDGISIGRYAGQTDQGQGSVALGYYAARTGQNEHSIAIGANAGQIDQGYVSIAIGRSAGTTNQSSGALALGHGAGTSNQSSGTIAIGNFAGATSQSTEAIAIGRSAGNDNQSQHGVAIGYYAGQIHQGITAVAIGEQAGNTDQSFRAIAIGRSAGHYGQGPQTVAIGALAGYGGQQDYAIAIGRHAGESSQRTNAIAIGNNAGRGLNPGTIESVPQATWVSGGVTGNVTMVLNTVSGLFLGMGVYGNGIDESDDGTVITAIDTGNVAITMSRVTTGDASGTYDFFGQQGANSIAIGNNAGASVQHPDSIIINATGVEVNSPSNGSFVVAPVRLGATGQPMFYNTSNNEVTYGGVGHYASTANGTTDGAIAIDMTVTKAFLAAKTGINASYTLADGLYDGQTIAFMPEWSVATVEQDVVNIRVFMSKIFDTNTSNGQYASGGVFPWYPFANINNGQGARSIATATWNAQQQNWVVDPYSFD